jgi:hypothetical protein
MLRAPSAVRPFAEISKGIGEAPYSAASVRRKAELQTL